MQLLRKAHQVYSRSFNGIFPLLEDFALLPEVKALIDPSNDEELTIESFNEFESELPDIVSRWKAERYEELRTISSIPTHVQGKDLALNHLLRCECRRVFSTSDLSAVLHTCFGDRDLTTFPFFMVKTGDGVYRQMSSCFDSGLAPRGLSALNIYVMEILEACGKGRLTTVQEMDNLNARLTCTMCRRDPRVRTIYTWRDAVSPFEFESSMFISPNH